VISPLHRAAALALLLLCGCRRGGGRAAPAAIPRPDLTWIGDAPLREAVLAAQNRIEAAPDSVEAWGDYGTLLASHDWRADGAAAFARAEELEPKNFRWPYQQGVALAVVDVARGLAAFERALRLDSAYPPAHVNRGRLLIEVARLDEARAEFETALKLDEKSLEGWLGLGQVKLLQRDPAGAEAALKRALALDPDHPEVHTALAAACFALGRKSEAEEHARTARAKARPVFPHDPRAEFKSPPVTAADHVLAAMQRIEGGRFDEAESYLRKAIAIDPNLATAWTNLGTVLLNKKDADGAEKALRESIRITPSMKAERTLSQVCWQRGQKAEAAVHLLAAVKLDPDDMELHHEAAMMLAQLARFGEASGLLAEVVAARPRDEKIALEYAVALRGRAFDELRRGQNAEGVASLRRAHEAKPDYLPVQCELAFVLSTHPAAEARDGAAAVKLAEEALAAHDGNPDALDALAAAYAECGRFDDAATTIGRALELARGAARTDAAKLFEERLGLYRSKQPLRVSYDARKTRKGSK
jgi:tetratricopeptide (TPR) repeat protein